MKSEAEFKKIVIRKKYIKKKLPARKILKNNRLTQNKPLGTPVITKPIASF